ncbi:hypothetical protein PR202_ga11936 [Eleusine coracana subsp. coracana]|uniref:Uncharacterized protein n=1 Tax=Eleusine coracana subsp. coracana TaxID=191504 RepID=A0AAV5CAX7_ELECO|nr:hypothetical protein PR202_ga11936 [Eleusine coracana subsp. coracana]
MEAKLVVYDGSDGIVALSFYAYTTNTTAMKKFLQYYDKQSYRYGSTDDGQMGKVLVGFGTDPASNGLKSTKGFFRVWRVL